MAVKMIEDAERTGAAQAWRHDHRRDVRQHRDGAGDCGGREGLQVHLHDDRQAVEGESGRVEGVRRRSHRLPDERRSRGSSFVLLGVVAPESAKCRTPGRPISTDNLSNTQAHYEQTAPEIWEQTGGKVDHLVVGVGTGGTISGVGRYLKEKNPADKGVGDRYLRIGVQEIQRDGRLRQERDLPVHHRRHRRGLPAARTSISASSITSKKSPTRTRR